MRTFTQAFKDAAVLAVLAEKRRPADVARELSVLPQTLHQWLKKHNAGLGSRGDLRKRDPSSERMEITQLRAEVAHLRAVIAILQNRQESNNGH